MKQIILLLFTAISSAASAQNISGKWEGNYTGFFGTIMRPQKLVVDLMITHDTIVNGSSHLYYNNGGYEHYRVTGVYRPGDSTIFFSEDSTIGKNIGATCLGDYSMKLSIRDTLMRFDGRWKDNSDDFVLLKCPTSGVWLERKIPRSHPVAAKKDPNLDRKSEIQSLIEIAREERDSIKIDLLDNAQIDNDVVSVYLNDSLVLHKLKLTAAPATFYLTLKKGMEICRIKMAAESMGSIPPCTALMVVSTKNNRYNVTLSSNFGNNGTLELFLKE
jgi:hypothetical protein